MKQRSLSRQRGMVLVTGLILLMMVTLIAVSTFGMGRTSLEIAGNMQANDRALMAADSAIEDAISTRRLFESPTAVYLNPCAGSNTKCMDTDGDGTTDTTVRLTPAPYCVQARTVMTLELDLGNAQDAGCSIGQPQSFGIVGTVTAHSLCSDSVWEANAQVSDASDSSRARIASGVAVRVPKDSVTTACP